jgi:hypothetical protein
MKYRLPQKYIDLGFSVGKFGKYSFALRCDNQVIFIFGSGLDLNDEFVGRLCDCHLQLACKV